MEDWRWSKYCNI